MLPCDCRVKRGANCGSDHHLVVSDVVYSYSHNKLPSEQIEKTTEKTIDKGDSDGDALTCQK